jgi:hypothetical protein
LIAFLKPIKLDQHSIGSQFEKYIDLCYLRFTIFWARPSPICLNRRDEAWCGIESGSISSVCLPFDERAFWADSFIDTGLVQRFSGTLLPVSGGLSFDPPADQTNWVPAMHQGFVPRYDLGMVKCFRQQYK